MKKYKRTVILLIIIALALSFGCGPREEPEARDPVDEDPRVVVPSPEDMLVAAEDWKEEYPLIYESFIRTSRMQDNKVEDSSLGGLHPIDYLKKYPNIITLYEGMGFSKEYYIARGHYYALEDVINTSRPKPGASCLACKTSEYEKLYVEHGDDLFARDFQKTSQEISHSISCYNCHRNEPADGEIQITSPHFALGIEKLETTPKAGTQACAQCHVEYYLDPETREVILPWDNGIGVDEIESFFDERDYYDWEHPRTGTPLIKVQHPEFEMYTGSIHDQMGVSCADCHMPRVEENGQEYKSHWAKSPLKTVEESCGRCHGADNEGLIAQVQEGQREIESLQVQVSDMLVKLIADFGVALEEQELDDDTIDQLRSLHRKSQYRWDFVFVENSTGFHDYDKARETLESAKEYAREALNILEAQ
ncbi:ammonia-forming cytochrome c nitrite reductase subunit c552 [Alkaliphilus peptidifermentans]|uniref:nitrite reductase (cytochrome; ammonia-forming) n=1 Tax=Alkaliphilus peptidifermentans DSM 18978 TaxID=1120976 RepID=A0A1G5BJT4_9FIRM|nr:ammonia-forming cytochrome c nitrite reductase subunit c552 [Alkaliphilus peptidifermentans]SCX90421.1 respiratory nitrite reductase (cytochrome ammonia-forming) precursor [Alkaliphilus peptidifermentans DSM 18978]